MVVLRWAIIGYLYQELLMLLRASASKQRLLTSLFATYPPHKVPQQHSLCLLTCLNSRHQRCLEVFTWHLRALWISCCFLRHNSGQPGCLPLHIGALPQRPPALRDPASSPTTAGRSRAEHPGSHVSCQHRQSQGAWRGDFCLLGTLARQPSAELVEGETAPRGPNEPATEVYHVVLLHRWVRWEFGGILPQRCGHHWQIQGVVVSSHYWCKGRSEATITFYAWISALRQEEIVIVHIL